MSSMSYYAVIPSWILSEKMPNAEKVMCVLLSALSQKNGYCYATNEFLAEALGTTTGAVIKMLGRLDQSSIISIHNKKSKKAGNRQIRLVFAERIASFDESEDGKKIADGAADQNPDDPFERFYEIYPRKEKRVPAQKMFKTKKLHTRIDELLQATRNYAREVADTDKQFIMLPSTFLNNQIWEEKIGQTDGQKIADGAAAQASADPFVSFANRLTKIALDAFNSGGLDGVELDQFDFSDTEKAFIESAGGFQAVLRAAPDGDFKKDYQELWESVQ